MGSLPQSVRRRRGRAREGHVPLCRLEGDVDAEGGVPDVEAAEDEHVGVEGGAREIRRRGEREIGLRSQRLQTRVERALTVGAGAKGSVVGVRKGRSTGRAWTSLLAWWCAGQA